MILRRIWALTLVLGLCQGCQPNPNQVEFVVADGFRGTFIIKPDVPDGVELEKEHGRFVVRIPKDGILGIKGHGPFNSYLCTARYDNGDVIWVSKRIDDKPQEGEVALLGGHTHIESANNGKQVGDYRWFVGTVEDWKSSRH